MKKLIVAMLCLTLLLAGCGADPQPAETTTKPSTQTEATTEAPTETTTEAPTEATTEANSLKAQAESCIGKTVEVLTIKEEGFSEISAVFPAQEADGAVIIRISSPTLTRDILSSLLLKVPLRCAQTAARRFLPDPNFVSPAGQR